MSRVKLTDILIIFAAFCMNACELGPLRSFGPFFLQFQNDLQASASQSSLVASLLFGSYYAAGPIASILSYKLGFRRTIMIGATCAVFGAVVCSLAKSIVTIQILMVLIGGGCGLGIVPKYTLLGRRFSKKRSLANNLASTGSSFAALPLPILVEMWNTYYTWRGAILLIGGIFLNIIPFGMLLTSSLETNEKTVKKANVLKLNMLKSWEFVCFLIACGCDLSSKTVFAVYVVRFGQYKGYGNYIAASMTSVIAAPQLILLPMAGYITSLTHVGPVPIVRPYFFAVACVIQAIAVSGMTFTSSLEATLALCVLLSVSFGCRGVLTATMAADFFGKATLETSLGLRSLTQGVFSALIPPLLGMVVDATGSYNYPLYGSGVLVLIAGVLVVIVHQGITNESTEHAMKEESNQSQT